MAPRARGPAARPTRSSRRAPRGPAAPRARAAAWVSGGSPAALGGGHRPDAPRHRSASPRPSPAKRALLPRLRARHVDAAAARLVVARIVRHDGWAPVRGGRPGRPGYTRRLFANVLRDHCQQRL